MTPCLPSPISLSRTHTPVGRSPRCSHPCKWGSSHQLRPVHRTLPLRPDNASNHPKFSAQGAAFIIRNPWSECSDCAGPAAHPQLRLIVHGSYPHITRGTL